MFKEQFIKICNERKIAPSKVCKDIGLSSAAYSCWTDNSIPRKATLMKLADYLNVTVDDLLGEDNTKEKLKQASEDSELAELLEELKTRPEMKMLFSITKGATKEDVEKAVNIIKALRESENG